MAESEKLLRELVALPSVNPAFLPAGDPRAGEAALSAFLAQRATRAGLEVDWQKVLPDRSNLLARLIPRGKIRRRVLFAPHLDTVNGSDEQFTPRIRAGRLYGRGASDTKGSVAAMFTALCQLARSGKRPAQTEVIFAGLVDEENAQLGSRTLASGRVKGSLAIVGEPTLLKTVTAHKGSMWLRLETRGTAAHGSRPELGRNAVETAAAVVLLIQREYAALLRARRHWLLGTPTVSVGVFAGGTQPNIVPDRAYLEVDRRTLPGETDAGVKREVRALLARAGLKAQCVNSKLAACLPMETNPQLPLVREFLNVCGQRKPAGVDYFCDASILSRGGTPSIVFGPGDISQAHTSDEWIELSQVSRAAAILTRFLQSLP